MKTIKRKCLNCNIEFDAKLSEVKRGFAKFCNKPCSQQYISKHRKPKQSIEEKEHNVCCGYCNKSFYIFPFKLKNSKTGLFFCSNEHHNLFQKANGNKKSYKEYSEDKKLKIRLRDRERRKKDPARPFLHSAKAADKRKGLENNLTYEFIKEQFEKPCQYCGSIENPSLDRIDNSKGHTIDNVIKCCIKCNYLRRDIPYEAWIIIAKAVKECVEKGLLDNYRSYNREYKVKYKGKINHQGDEIAY